MESYTDNTPMIHRAALKIAGKGKPVFPCKLDKSPHTPKGFKDATTDPARITAFWNRYPGAKIGMPTGSSSGVFVFDVDRLEALEELPPELRAELDQTLVIRTPSGGLHFYFNHVDGITNRTGRLPDGIDIRGEGGYVIVCPSDGYTIERRAPTADAPAGLIGLLKDEPKSSGTRRRSGPRSSGVDDGEPIPDGRRNETLASIAGRLHDGTRDLGQLEDDLIDVNEARCIPPLQPDQVRRIARSIYRYEPCRPARRETDPEAAEALADIERALLRREWRGKGGKTRYSIAVAALKIARLHGVKVADGVRVEVSARQLALAAAVSRISVVRNLKDMDGILRPDNENVQDGKSGAIILLAPPARTDTTPPTESVSKGGCISSRAPLTAPRLRWSSPARRARRGLVKGTTKVRDGVIPEKRAAVIRLGKSCERLMDSLEAAGGSMTLSALADAIDVKRSRDLTRRRNPGTGKGRDGFVTRLENVGVLEVVGDTVTLAEDWLEALDRERDSAGEIDLYKRDMRRYNEQSKAYRNRHKVKPDYHSANVGADGFIGDLSRDGDGDAGRQPKPELPTVSPLAESIRDYLDRNPHDACQPAGWLASTLWTFDLYPSKASPADAKNAIAELGGEAYLREHLERAREAVA